MVITDLQLKELIMNITRETEVVRNYWGHWGNLGERHTMTIVLSLCEFKALEKKLSPGDSSPLSADFEIDYLDDTVTVKIRAADRNVIDNIYSQLTNRESVMTVKSGSKTISVNDGTKREEEGRIYLGDAFVLRTWYADADELHALVYKPGESRGFYLCDLKTGRLAEDPVNKSGFDLQRKRSYVTVSDMCKALNVPNGSVRLANADIVITMI